MEALFYGGLIVDLIIRLTLLEGLVLALLHGLTGRGVAPSDYALNLVSGLCLMLALRCTLAQLAWPWIALCLAASGMAHALDLWRRWHNPAA